MATNPSLLTASSFVDLSGSLYWRAAPQHPLMDQGEPTPIVDPQPDDAFNPDLIAVIGDDKDVHMPPPLSATDETNSMAVSMHADDFVHAASVSRLSESVLAEPSSAESTATAAVSTPTSTKARGWWPFGMGAVASIMGMRDDPALAPDQTSATDAKDARETKSAIALGPLADALLEDATIVCHCRVAFKTFAPIVEPHVNALAGRLQQKGEASKVRVAFYVRDAIWPIALHKCLGDEMEAHITSSDLSSRASIMRHTQRTVSTWNSPRVYPNRPLYGLAYVETTVSLTDIDLVIDADTKQTIETRASILRFMAPRMAPNGVYLVQTPDTATSAALVSLFMAPAGDAGTRAREHKLTITPAGVVFSF